MAYFVTGATGFIGSYLVAKLVKRRGPVYALVRKSSLPRLAELREALPTAAGLSTLWRAIDRLGVTVKKNGTRRRTAPR